MAYKPFLISDFKLGQQSNTEPFLLPEQAFESLSNAYLNKGSVIKREGLTQFDKFPEIVANITACTKANPCQVTAGTHGLSNGDIVRLSGISGMVELNNADYTVTKVDNDKFTLNSTNSTSYTTYTSGGVVSTFCSDPIMGLKRHIKSDGTTELLCFTDNRAALYNDTSEVFLPIENFSEILGRGDGATKKYTGTLVFKPILTSSFAVTDGTEIFSDNGDGTLTGDGGGSGTIVYATGAYSITFNANVTDGIAVTSTYRCQGDIFTGDNTDFFNSVNYDDKLWITNSKDRILTFNGSVLEPHIFDLTNQARTTNQVSRCSSIKVFKERLVLVDTTEDSVRYPQRVRWCQAGNTDIWQDTVSGRGSSLDISTGQWFQCTGFAREDLVLFFQNSTFLMRYISNPDVPFTITKLNSSRSIDAPYSIIESDQGVISLGKKSIIACDGVNVQDIDQLIPDYTLTMNQTYIKQAFGFYHGENDQLYMLYPSSETIGDTTVKSDKMLVLDQRSGSWSTYNIDLSCFGYYNVGSDKTLGDFGEATLEDMVDVRLDSYLFMSEAPLLLAGGHNGIIYNMSAENSDDIDTAIDVEIKTKRFNFFAEGVNSRLGKVDLLMDITKDKTITVNFYTNFNTTPYLVKTIEPTTEADLKWYTVYVNRSANTHKIGIQCSDSNANFKLSAIRYWVYSTDIRGV